MAARSADEGAAVVTKAVVANFTPTLNAEPLAASVAGSVNRGWERTLEVPHPLNWAGIGAMVPIRTVFEPIQPYEYKSPPLLMPLYIIPSGEPQSIGTTGPTVGMGSQLCCKPPSQPLLPLRKKGYVKRSGRSWVCEQCGKTYTARSSIRYHLTSHAAKDFPCPFTTTCGKVFLAQTSLRRHVRTVHSHDTPPGEGELLDPGFDKDDLLPPS